MAELRELLMGALYLLGRDRKRIKIEELFKVAKEIEEREGVGDSVLEELEEMSREGIIKIEGDEVVLTDFGLAKCSSVFASLLDKNPSVALDLLRLCRFQA